MRKFLVLAIVILALQQSTNAQKQFKALLVVNTKGWHHESIHAGVIAMQELGRKNFFDVVLWENPGGFNDKYLEQFKVIIFLNTTGDILDTAQQGAMERFIRSGKGFVGIHSASDTEYDWEWYTKLVGRMFNIHPANQTARLKVVDNNFPGLQGLSNGKLWTDEWYDFSPEKTSGLQYILTVDESSYNPKAQWGNKKNSETNGMHPISWYHDYDGGRAFYTALGHLPTVYSDEAFLNHVFAGIIWAATGKK